MADMNKYLDIIEENKEQFKSILREKIVREGANVEGLIEKLESSDFFYAPASTKYHCNYEGGLCQHSLNVYNNLRNLVVCKGLENVIPEESVVICALLHDLSKMNFYEPTVKNKKVYFESGTKEDSMGKYDWVSEKGWGYVPEEQRFIFGNHEETSEFMVRTFIPLDYVESIAILNHHGGLGYDSIKDGFAATHVYNRNLLAMLLHTADMLATYIDEKKEDE